MIKQVHFTSLHQAHQIDLATAYPAWHLNRQVLRVLDPNIIPPTKPQDEPDMPQERSHERAPDLGPGLLPIVLVVFSHGKESGPSRTKINHLSRIALRHGATVLSVDYRDVDDPDQRVDRLLGLDLPNHDKLILVGSSMGGYVSTVASKQLKPCGLFLMAPAIYMPGYVVQNMKPGTENVCIVHGWKDEIVPVEHTLKFAKTCSPELHLIEADHRLNLVLPTVGRLFEDFLQRSLQSQ